MHTNKFPVGTALPPFLTFVVNLELVVNITMNDARICHAATEVVGKLFNGKLKADAFLVGKCLYTKEVPTA